MNARTTIRTVQALAVGLALTLSACDKKDAADPEVAKAAELAKKIEADPDSAEKVLEEASMSVEDFEALMMDIAADPKKTEAFEAAKAS